MNIVEWMQREGLSDGQLAKLLGHKRTDSVRRWKNFEVIPQERHRKKLKKISKDQINIFFQ